MINTHKDSNFFKQVEKEITAELNSRRENVLKEFSKIKGYEATINSLHGTISLAKSTSLDMIRGNWIVYEDYISSWLLGIKDLIQSGRGETMIQKILSVDSIREYIFLFLERDFYRHYQTRIKEKPQENLWTIWFGNETLFWGLLISPRFFEDNWDNKPSHIRKVEFSYWTIGHILKTGIVDPENNKIITFKDINDFLNFYESILKRVSNSIYEKQIFDFYCEYIRNSTNPLEEPLLIPEFRYDGLAKKHKYRLDFTILNYHTGEKIGFELSPQSSHMSVSGIRTKSQVEMNADLTKKWNKEMIKRNEYFQQYGITIITFTDSHLINIDDCFKTMKHYLEKRKTETMSVDELVAEIISLK